MQRINITIPYPYVCYSASRTARAEAEEGELTLQDYLLHRATKSRSRAGGKDLRRVMSQSQRLTSTHFQIRRPLRV